MAYQYILYEKEDHIARITLNKPEKLNVIKLIGMGEDFQEIMAALNDAEWDDDVKVVVFKGAGRSFCAGEDLMDVGFVYGWGTGKPGEKRPSQRIRLLKDRVGLNDGFRRLLFFPKVTIAQVHGYCLDGGFGLASCCDLIVAAEDAQLGNLGARTVGWMADIPPYPLLISRVGLTRAWELLLGLTILSGTEAVQWGLINKAVPLDELEDEVNEIARKISLLTRDALIIQKAQMHIIYETLGFGVGLETVYSFHALLTNMSIAPDEANFYKLRRDKGLKAAIADRDERWAKPAKR